MAHITSSVENGIHCLLWLVGSDDTPLSSRDLADLQGISASFLAKIFSKLEKAGIVAASDGVRGGFRLARKPEAISFLEIVDAIEGSKPLFDCQEIRARCAVFGDQTPAWVTTGVCAIHAVMLQAEQAMRDELAAHTLADMIRSVERKAPSDFFIQIGEWKGERTKAKKPGRATKVSDPRS